MSSQKEPQKVDLYDYIYKDAERLNSLYSQLFKGIINYSTHSNTGTNSSESTGKGKIGFSNNHLQADLKKQESNATGSAITVLPHDYSLSFLIEYLFDNDYIATDFESASNNSLVLLKGSINIVEKSFTEALIDSVEENNTELLKSNKKNTEAQKTDAKNTLRGIKAYKKFNFDSSFYFDNNGLIAAGFIKEEFLTDKLASISMLFGGKDIQEVNMIGIKHLTKDVLTGSHLPHSVFKQSFHNSIRTIHFDKIEHIVTPIVIFRMLK